MDTNFSMNDSSMILQYINNINNSFNVHNSSMYGLANNVIIETSNLFRDKYYGKLLQLTQKYTMTESEFKKYKYRPKLFSLDKLGSPHFWYLLLLINNMSSITQFNKKTIFIFNNLIEDELKEVILYEEKNIIDNKNEIEKIINNK